MVWAHSPATNTNLATARRVHQQALRRVGAIPRLPSKVEMLRMYETMNLIRVFETQAWKSAVQHEGLPIHPSTGHEAIAVGVCSSLRRTDRVVSNHRPFGHFIAKGGSTKHLMAELQGKSTGVCRGLGGEMILSEPSIGFLFSSMIVGACITISTGVGLALKLKASRAISVGFFGDAAATNGAFHEAMNMAALYRLPVLFVCENNGYSTNSPAMEYLPMETVSQLASGYGFPTSVVDGTDVLAVREAASKAVWHIRNKGTPYFLEALTSRIGPHKQILIDTRSSDRTLYARMRDPITRFRASLFAVGQIDDRTDKRIIARVKREVRDAVGFARRGRPLESNDLHAYIY